MIVPVNPNVRIRKLDSRNWGIEVRRTRKDPLADPWDVEGFYVQLTDALHGLVQRHTELLVPEERMTLESLTEVICQVIATIPHLAKNVTPSEK